MNLSSAPTFSYSIRSVSLVPNPAATASVCVAASRFHRPLIRNSYPQVTLSRATLRDFLCINSATASVLLVRWALRGLLVEGLAAFRILLFKAASIA